MTRLVPGEMCDLLALGYIRHRHRPARKKGQVPGPAAQIPLDDVAPEGRVPPTTGSTTKEEGKG